MQFTPPPKSNALCDFTGWRRSIGCLKLQVIFRKRATIYRALLWKMTCEDEASCDSLYATLYPDLTSRLPVTACCCPTWFIFMQHTATHCNKTACCCAKWFIFMRDVTESYAWRDSVICVTWLIDLLDVHVYDMTIFIHVRYVSLAWHSSFLCVTCVILMCDMTHSYVWHDSIHSCAWHASLLCVIWLTHMCNMTHSYAWRDSFFMWHDSFLHVTWLIRMSDMTHAYEWHDSFLRVTCLILTCNMTHSYVWHDSFLRVT